MESLVFRNDDVNPNTNFKELSGIYNTIKKLYPKSDIISCVTVFGRYSPFGSVYPDVPFKNKAKEWFFRVDRCINELDIITKDKIASHGLIHNDHSELDRDAQKMSILTSCSYLNTDLFVPPFNKYNHATREICDSNGIIMIDDLGQWKSLEYEPFDPTHRFWYFHSWRFNAKSIKEALRVSTGK